MSTIENTTGTIFSIPNVHNDTILGRILFDSTFFYKQNLLTGQGKWMADEGYAVLIEVYYHHPETGEKQIVIPGVNTSPRNIETGKWPIVGNEKIDLKLLDFPEFLSDGGPNTRYFTKGEMKIKFSFKDGKYDAPNLEVYPGTFAALNLHDCFYYTRGEMDKLSRPRENYDAIDLSKNDLRCSLFRKEIYELIGENMDTPYFDLSKKYGVDIERLSSYF